MTGDERRWVMHLTLRHTPLEALWAAAAYDVKSLSLQEQNLYDASSPVDKVVFLILDPESSLKAAEWFAAGMTSQEAVGKALQLDIAALSSQEQAFVSQLTAQNRLVYLSLSLLTQLELASETEANFDGALAEAAKQDVAKLYDDEEAFYHSLPEGNERLLYLVLTPDARGMAVALTRGVDPNDAMGYFLSIYDVTAAADENTET